jgi:hypothetical protein
VKLVSDKLVRFESERTQAEAVYSDGADESAEASSRSAASSKPGGEPISRRERVRELKFDPQEWATLRAVRNTHRESPRWSTHQRFRARDALFRSRGQRYDASASMGDCRPNVSNSCDPTRAPPDELALCHDTYASCKDGTRRSQ